MCATKIKTNRRFGHVCDRLVIRHRLWWLCESAMWFLHVRTLPFATLGDTLPCFGLVWCVLCVWRFVSNAVLWQTIGWHITIDHVAHILPAI